MHQPPYGQQPHPSGHYPPTGQPSGQYPHNGPTYMLQAPPPGPISGPGMPIGMGQPGPNVRYPQPPTPKKPPRRWPWILGIILASIIWYNIGYGVARSTPNTNGANQNTQTPVSTKGATATPTKAATPKPTQAPKWVAVKTFTGTGSKKTESFRVANRWRLIWECQADDAPLYIHIMQVDGTPLDSGPSTTCKPSGTKDSSELYKGGEIYLDVISGIDWKIEIQELK